MGAVINRCVFVVLRPRMHADSRICALADNLEFAKRVCLEHAQVDYTFPLADGWFVPSERQGDDKFGINSGYLSLFDYGYADTGWSIEWREVESSENPVRV